MGGSDAILRKAELETVSNKATVDDELLFET
jgi:hypothetical protein